MSCLLFLLLMPVAAGADWFPVPVRSWPTLQADGRVQQSDYQPLLAAAQAWPICVVLPHRKDDYWRAVDWGLKQEAARLGVRLGIYYGGGYDDLPRFNRLLEQRCLAGDYRAVIIGALSETGHEALLEKFAAAGKPVIDLINGMDSRHIAAKSLLSFSEMGAAAARQLNAPCARKSPLPHCLVSGAARCWLGAGGRSGISRGAGWSLRRNCLQRVCRHRYLRPATTR